jgi:hypothetical protein
MADKNKEKLDKPITDVELSEKLSYDICENYKIALEFINSNPDYSLLKFRKIIKSVIRKISKKFKVELKGNSLEDYIDSLFKMDTDIGLKKRYKHKPLNDNLHIVRKLCNEGIHEVKEFNKSEELENSNNKNEYDKENEILKENAKEARKIIILIFRYVHFIIYKNKLIPIKDVDINHNREIICKALTSTDFNKKLKAGIAYENIFADELHSTPKIDTNDFEFHLKGLRKSALAFYEAAYKISAQLDNESYSNTKEKEKIIFNKCELEPLYRYAVLGLSSGNNDEKFKKLIEVAAKRRYKPAKALFGVMLYKEAEFKKLYKSDRNKFIEHLKLVVDIGYPDALAILGKFYYQGEYIPEDKPKAKKLLEKSATLGSAIAQQFIKSENKKIEVKNKITEATIKKNKVKITKKLNKMEKMIEAQESTTNQKPIKVDKKPGRNDLCWCGSRKKYKKCHGSPNKKIQQ